MTVAAQVIDARVSRRLGAYLDASRPRAAPRRPSPSLRQDGTPQEVFAEEARQAPDPGAPRNWAMSARSGPGLQAATSWIPA